MNGIQEYLIEVAVAAARDAAGRLVATSNLNSVLVAQSLEELLQKIELLDKNAVSQVSCNLEYKGWEMAKQRSLNSSASIEPIFFKKPDKS